jgi:hypothetical protein
LKENDVNELQRITKSDAYSPWYTIWTAAFFVLLWAGPDLDRIFNLWLLLVPIIFIPAVALAGILVISLILSLIRRQWRRAGSIVAAPAIVLFLSSTLVRLGITPELIRFELSKSAYSAEVAATPATDGPRLRCWDWGETGGAGVVNVFWTLVFDESDRIALPPSSWSTDWVDKVASVNRDGGSRCHAIARLINENHATVSRLGGHFFVIEEVWP